MYRIFSIFAFILVATATSYLKAAADDALPTDTLVIGAENPVATDSVDKSDKSVVVVDKTDNKDFSYTTVASANDINELGRKPFALTSEPYDPSNRNWWYLLKHNKLSLQDSTVQYPRFLKFCVDVYNWGDRTFNSYDTDYVEGTGTRWKAIIKTDAWFDSYAMNFYRKMPMRMLSDGWINLGGYLHYMAVSVGYSLDMSNVIGNKPINHKKFEFSFTCARFNINFSYFENTGGTYMRQFGDYNHGKLMRTYFPGVKARTYNVTGYYFFNNRRYSQGAAYAFTKYQKRNQGSWIIGFTFYNQNLNVNLQRLPESLLPYLKIPVESHNVHYNSYSLIGGYGYNWVIAKNLLYNITVLPAIGINHTFDDSIEGRRNLLGLHIAGKTALTYNIGDVFLSLAASIDGDWYKSKMNSFFSSVESTSFSVGVRF